MIRRAVLCQRLRDRMDGRYPKETGLTSAPVCYKP